MIKKYPLLFRFFIFVILPIAAYVIFVFVHLKSSVTPADGKVSVAGLHHPVQISHDEFGTPSIIAKTDHDAYFGLGFKHASDRLWQLELQRRMVQGRLSEILGPDALTQDIWMRTLGLQDAAKQSVKSLSPETIEALTAYSEGINAWVAQASSLPPEFQLLGIKPEPWTIYDSLCWQKMFAYVLNGNMFDEIRRDLLLQHLTPAQVKFLYSYDPLDVLAQVRQPVNSNLIAKQDTLIQFGIGHKSTGSNAWVVSGKHTKTGRPILANDPHMGLELPAVWYAASVKGDKLDVSGMTLVGLPMVIFGQNADIAWGGTSLMSDQQDLFVENTSSQHPNQYQNGNDWIPFDSHNEIIKIATSSPAFLNDPIKPVEIVVRKTTRGPIISDARSAGDQILSLRWAALDADDRTVESFFKIQYAKNWDEFRQSLALLKAPGLNFVYADRVGNIGYQVAGMMPKRNSGIGILPQVASQTADWTGYYDFNLLPSILNPDNGFLVSANEPVEHTKEIVISHDWAPSARHDRIAELLQQTIASGKQFDINEMSSMQNDRQDKTALSLLPYLKNVQGKTDQQKQAIDELNKWNGEFSSDSVGATIFATWSYYLTHEIFDPVLRYSWQRPVREDILASSVEQVDWARLAVILSTNDHGWCKANQTSPCSVELENSLGRALQQIEKIRGTTSVAKWTWGKVSRTEFVHQPFGQVKGLEFFFKKTAYFASSPNSINASNNQFDSYRGYVQNFGAAFRQVIELDNKRSHEYMISTGESGNIMSPHFDDMMDSFAASKLVPFVPGQTNKFLNLVPVNGQQ